MIDAIEGNVPIQLPIKFNKIYLMLGIQQYKTKTMLVICIRNIFNYQKFVILTSFEKPI